MEGKPDIADWMQCFCSLDSQLHLKKFGQRQVPAIGMQRELQKKRQWCLTPVTEEHIRPLDNIYTAYIKISLM